MRRLMNGIAFAGAACALIAVSGCASIEDVEHAQATADRAQATADRALTSASQAQQAANSAQSAADRAQQAAVTAQSAAERAVTASNQSRTDITALNQQFENMQPRRGMRD